MNTIIHFTTNFERLKSILSESSFRLHYCREPFFLGKKISSRPVHPMVSFSEYGVNTINQKIITYGKFGIGLTKKWAKKKKLHPVLYIDKHSTLANALSDLLRARRATAPIQLARNVKLSIMTIKCFTKNIRGYNSYFKMDNFNFRAEKEWRFVPTKTEIDGNLISRSERLYNKRVDFYNDKLKRFPLRFEKLDIAYIFVETEGQRIDIIKRFAIHESLIKISNWATLPKV